MGKSTKTRTELNIDGERVAITNIEKLLWSQKTIKKYDYLKFLTVIAPYMLPFLKDRLLTVIRFPNGIEQESFYQKNCPDYAPSYIETKLVDGIKYIVCSRLASLIWLGNQSAVEFHIPFQTINNKNPSEIVLDLDPPSQTEFPLAVEASLILKEIFDKLHLHAFIKTSGNKGLQIYIPLNEQFSYSETRIFTSFIANYLVTKYPKSFTIERLKKNRNKRLYVDFLQHAEGKTIIAPFSLRGNEQALMATPVFWSEVNEGLHPSQFPMEEGIARINKGILPFNDYFKVKKKQPFRKVLEIIKQ